MGRIANACTEVASGKIRAVERDEEISDVFIAHASEDKEAVARPLADALIAQGWSVWLDELKLTIGDSLSSRIDAALARTRFGVVILSPSFFSKEWPQRELAGLAAQELDTGAKVILPVWHEVDHHYIVQRSPVLADRLGAPTGAGIGNVAKELSAAINGSVDGSAAEMPQAEAIDDKQVERLFSIPTTDEEQAELLEERPDWWEYRLYAGVLVQGRINLEDKWQDHELRLSRGARREASEDVIWDFLSRELGWMRRQVSAINRVFDQEILVRAFGMPGEAGDPDLIKRVAHGIIQIYGSMLDWAAELRNSSVPSDYEDVVEFMACMVDGPLRQIRDFTQNVADQIAKLPILLEEAEENGATIDSPMTLTLTLSLSLDQNDQANLDAEFERLRGIQDA